MLPGNVYNFGPDMPALLRTDTPQPGGTTCGEKVRGKLTRLNGYSSS